MSRSRKLFFASAAAGAMLAGAVGVLIPLTPAGAGGSATINVDTTDDENNVDGDCSLREAVESANTNLAVDDCEAGLGDDTVMIPAGTYEFVAEGDGDIDVTTNVAFVGAGAATTIIDAKQEDRVFDLNGDEETNIAVSFDGLTITGGSVRGSGGGIDADHTDLTVSDSVITANEALSGDGGGIRNDEGNTSLTIENSVISNNTSSSDGGGFEQDNSDTTVTVVDSTITGNTAGSEGGGIHIDNGAETTITGSTISDNVALEEPSVREGSFQGFRGADPSCEGGGGGFSQDSTGSDPSTLIVNTTISGNTAPNCEGGGIYVAADLVLTHVTLADNGAAEGGNVFSVAAGDFSVQVENTVIADPRTSTDCVVVGDPLVSAGANVDTDASCGFDQAADQTVADAVLAALADNGGTTETHLPQAGSPLIDAALDDFCEADDQRDVTRPQDGDGDGTTACDIGAVEVEFTPEETTTTTTTTTAPDGEVDADTATPAAPTVARPTFTG